MKSLHLLLMSAWVFPHSSESCIKSAGEGNRWMDVGLHKVVWNVLESEESSNYGEVCVQVSGFNKWDRQSDKDETRNIMTPVISWAK